MTERVFFVIEPNAKLIVEPKKASHQPNKDHHDEDQSYEPGFVIFEPNPAKD